MEWESERASSEGSGGPRSVVRAMEILYEISQRPDGVALAVITDRLGLPKTSVFSLLKALEHGGYVEAAGGVYRLSAEAYRLGAAISGSRVFPNCVRPAFEAVAEATGETAILGVLKPDAMEALYCDVIESPNPLRFTVKVGDARPLYASTTGKIFMAYFRPERLMRYVDTVEREQFTQKTLTGKEDLLADIAEIRRTGIASNFDGMIDGVTSYGVPVFGPDNAITAALVISGPDTRMRPKASAIKEMAVAAGQEMSRLLNFRGSYPPIRPKEI